MPNAPHEHSPARGSGPLVICYDASEGARRALVEAARLFPGALAVVLHVWQSVTASPPFAYSVGASMATLGPAVEELEREGAAAAARVAHEGAEIARAEGLRAESLAVPAERHVWSEIVRLAEEREAAVIVLGSRGLSPVRSVVLGSVSNGVAHHARRPVLVVPSEAQLLRLESLADPFGELIALHELPTPGPGGD